MPLLDSLQLEMIGYCHSIAFLFLLYCYLLTLDCYLQQFTSVKLLSSAMRADIQHRFSAAIEPSAQL